MKLFVECNRYDLMRRRWKKDMDEKERTMDVIKCYVYVNDNVESETKLYLGEVWT